MGKLSFDNDAGVGANDEIIDVSPNAAVKDALKAAITPGAKPDSKPTTEEMLAMGQTPEGRDALSKMLGILNVEKDGDDVIDIPNRPEMDALTKMVGGAEAMPAATQAFREAMSLVGVGPDNIGDLVEGMTPEEENSEIADTIREWNEILGNPMKAQAMLQKIYAHPMQEPGRSYFLGKGSPELNDAIAKLWQATQGEAPTGRPRSRGDGRVY